MKNVKKTSEYGNTSISSLKGADRVRKRPGVIFGSDGLEGCEHAVFEILSNSIDEAKEGHGDIITVTRYLDGSIEVEDFGRGCPVDWNEKEGKYNWELVFCELYAGGKDVGAVLGELSTLTRDLLLRKTAPEGGAALLSGGFDSATLDQLGKDVPSNRFLYLASTLQKAAADLYYSADRRTDAELCLLRLCDESLCGDLTALENRITRLEDAAARGAVISAAVNQSVSAAKAIGAAPVSQAPAKPASKPVEPPPAEDPPPWDEPPLPEEPPMREEPGERVFDIPEDAIPVRPAQPKAVPAKPAASIPSAPKPQTAVHSAAPVSGDWWKALSENCKGQIPPMYRAVLDLCGGVLEGDQLTVFAPDEITLNRLDNDRVRGVLSAEAEKVSGQPVRLLLREGEPPKPSPEENLKQLLQFGSQFDNIEIK